MKFDDNNDRVAKLEVRQIQGTWLFLENQDDFKETMVLIRVLHQILFVGDTDRRVAFYNMESDTYEEDDDNNYMWDGKRTFG